MLTVVGYNKDKSFLIKDSVDDCVEEVTIEALKHYVCDLHIKIVGLVYEGENAFNIHGFSVVLDRPLKKLFGKWYILVIPAGEPYGLSLTSYYKKTTVHFYDSSVKWDRVKYPYGQFVAVYSLSTVLSVEGCFCLDTSNADCWTVSAIEMKEINDWLLRAKLSLGE